MKFISTYSNNFAIPAIIEGITELDWCKGKYTIDNLRTLKSTTDLNEYILSAIIPARNQIDALLMAVEADVYADNDKTNYLKTVVDFYNGKKTLVDVDLMHSLVITVDEDTVVVPSDRDNVETLINTSKAATFKPYPCANTPIQKILAVPGGKQVLAQLISTVYR